MHSVALNARNAADPWGFGTSRDRISLVVQQVTQTVSRDVVLNKRVQSEMCEYLCGALISTEVLGSLRDMQEKFKSIIQALPLAAHREAIKLIINSINDFVNVAGSLSAISGAAAIISKTNSDPSNLDEMSDYVNSLNAAFLESDYVDDEIKCDFLDQMDTVQSEPNFNIGMKVACEMFRITTTQYYFMQEINNALNELVDALAGADNNVYYPILQRV
jgi:hypothetical protein